MYYKGSYISRNQILLHLMRWMFLYKHCDLQSPRLPSKKKTMKLSCKNDSFWTSASLWHQSWWHEYISAWFLICQQQTKPWTTSFVKWTFCEKLDYDCFWWRKINVCCCRLELGMLTRYLWWRFCSTAAKTAWRTQPRRRPNQQAQEKRARCRWECDSGNLITNMTQKCYTSLDFI